MACRIDGCTLPVHGKGMCRSHYMRAWRYGDPAASGHRGRGRKTAKSYNWPRNTNVTPMPTPCREFQGARNAAGYGSVSRNGKNVRVHRLMWEMAHGPIPPGLIVMHKCDNRSCFRIDHLQLGTPSDNSLDMARKGRAPRARARLTPADVIEIRRRRALGDRCKALAQDFGVSPGTIGDLLKGRTWRDVA